MSSNSLISVIIPSYNRANTLPRAIESVLEQTDSHFELIIVDDASTDDTKKIKDFYKSNHRITFYENSKNMGVSYSRNQGVLLAKGDFLAFLDSDDSWYPNKLKLQREYFINHPQCPLVHCEETWIRNGRQVNPKKIHQKSGGNIFEKSLRLCLISPSSVMLKRSVLKDFGGWNENFIVCEDYDLWLKITSQYSVGFLETPLVMKYGGHEDQLSRKYFAMDYWRIKSINALLENFELTVEQRAEALYVLKEKSSILINGFRKHNNLGMRYEEALLIAKSWNLYE